MAPFPSQQERSSESLIPWVTLLKLDYTRAELGPDTRQLLKRKWCILHDGPRTVSVISGKSLSSRGKMSKSPSCWDQAVLPLPPVGLLGSPHARPPARPEGGSF